MRSRGGMVAVTGGVGLFAAGLLIGRTVRLDRRALMRTGLAAAAGLAAGWFVASQTTGKPRE